MKRRLEVLATVAEIRRREHRAWFERTEHCGQCGNPGTYCTCTAVCGCADLHELGSAFRGGSVRRIHGGDASGTAGTVLGSAVGPSYGPPGGSSPLRLGVSKAGRTAFGPEWKTEPASASDGGGGLNCWVGGADLRVRAPDDVVVRI